MAIGCERNRSRTETRWYPLSDWLIIRPVTCRVEFARRYPAGWIEDSFTLTGDLGVGSRSREARPCEACDEA
ncbi:hypothetical protein GCM10023191_080340 [Actinoallomurus oryzae]|uniref:Uncharacterized protein n=1 Tax=Actinoallomurus oryzae TaxID=502180 RepID=A0ABP8QYN1_9ACTN